MRILLLCLLEFSSCILFRNKYPYPSVLNDPKFIPLTEDNFYSIKKDTFTVKDFCFDDTSYISTVRSSARSTILTQKKDSSWLAIFVIDDRSEDLQKTLKIGDKLTLQKVFYYWGAMSCYYYYYYPNTPNFEPKNSYPDTILTVEAHIKICK